MVAYPIFLTSPPPPPPAPSLTTSLSSLAAVDNSSGGGGGNEIPAFFFSRNAFVPESTSATSPEAMTFLQLLNGVDMANVLLPDALGRACAYYAFLLLEGENGENEEKGEGGGERRRRPRRRVTMAATMTSSRRWRTSWD